MSCVLVLQKKDMGNCIRKCFHRFDSRKKYLRTRYDVERQSSIEFENLMDDETAQTEMNRLLTDREHQLLSSKQYNSLLHDQKQRDDEIDEKLQEQEEQLRKEEEAYYEAKREAACIAHLQKAKDNVKGNPNLQYHRSWLNANRQEQDMPREEDDFESFLAGVKARSLQGSTYSKGGISYENIDHSTTPEGHFLHKGGDSETCALSSDFEWDEFTASDDIKTRTILREEQLPEMP